MRTHYSACCVRLSRLFGDGMLIDGNLAQPGANEGVAGAEMVVEKAQGAVFGGGREPERELGEFDGQRVEVHAVDALLGDTPFPIG